MTYKVICDSDQFDICAFKGFARIADDVHDGEVHSILRSCVLRVQQQADLALLPCTIEIVGEGRDLQLWQPSIGDILSVVDESTGGDVLPGCRVEGRMLHTPYPAVWRVTYTTVPDAAAVEALRPYVWQLAAAILDGNTEEESKVMQRIPISYVVQ